MIVSKMANFLTAVNNGGPHFGGVNDVAAIEAVQYTCVIVERRGRCNSENSRSVTHVQVPTGVWPVDKERQCQATFSDGICTI